MSKLKSITTLFFMASANASFAEIINEEILFDLFAGVEENVLGEDPYDPTPKTITQNTVDCLEVMAFETPSFLTDAPMEDILFYREFCESGLWVEIDAAGYSGIITIDDFRSPKIYEMAKDLARRLADARKDYDLLLANRPEREVLVQRLKISSRLLGRFLKEVEPLREACINGENLLSELEQKDPDHELVLKGLGNVCGAEKPYKNQEVALTALIIELTKFHETSKTFNVSELPDLIEVDLATISSEKDYILSRISALKEIEYILSE